ncbi:DUF2085 domain-containing protein [Halopenitus persicus]|uniref:Predicted membrane protein n=1 Tax=Halopenitus persicus TaxID=1048396 RepID=A0A1H3FPN9_9EURY|nr:DUF2085 domain-containing protein [Halopenitus persicus]SDX92767.1 Predicted membrane protein [Halopenitus persicus]
MDRDVLRRELRAGLAETRRYLLSHHEPAEYDRCHRLRVGSRTIHLCARCSGVHPGIAVGIVLGTGGWLGGTLGLAAIAVLPIAALVDWTLTAGRPEAGSNRVRTATGLLLGTAYGLGLHRLLLGGDRRVLLIGFGYAAVVAVALWSHRGSPVGS